MKKLFTFAVCVVMLFCAIFAGACNADTPRASLEIKNDGVSVLWKYGDEDVWHELVKLKDLKGSDGIDGVDGVDGKNGKDGANGKDGKDGKDGRDGVDGENGKDGVDGKDGIDGNDGVNGKDGVDGVNGKDGVDGKTVEIQTNETHIQWRYAGEEWQNLIAIADIKGPAGERGKDGRDGIDGTNGKDGLNGKDGKTPEFRVEEGVFQWRYSGEEIWFNLYDLSLLKGKDGADGKDGLNGKDGKDGIDGINGKDGKDGVCAGYFYAQGNALTTLSFTEKTNNGNLIAYNSADCSIKLKGGHAYSLCFSGSLSLNAKKTDCVFGAALVDGYDNNQCMNSTLIRVNSTTGNMTYQGPMIYNRIYVATEDITLKFMLTNYMLIETTVSTFNYNLTIIALN